MSTKTLNIRHKINGTAADASSMKLSDPTGAFGVRRQSTGAVVVADGTDFVREDVGIYHYTITGLTAGVVYEYWVESVYAGATSRTEGTFIISNPVELQSYVTLSEAEDIAAILLPIAKWTAATDGQKTAALFEASNHISSAMRYQGRKYDQAQELEFPRVDGCRVIDVDASTDLPVVPLNVKRATVKQAQAILTGEIAAKMARLAKGLTGKKTGTVEETFVAAGTGSQIDPAELLTLEVLNIMKRYRLVSGGLR